MVEAGLVRTLPRSASETLPIVPARFELATPTGTPRPLGPPWHEVTASHMEQSPDRLFFVPGVEKVIDDEIATHTENTVDVEDRMLRIGEGLNRLVDDPDAVKFVVKVEQLLVDYQHAYETWLEKDYHARCKTTSKEFAKEVLADLSVSGFPTENEWKRHVYAVGKMAGYDNEYLRRLCKELWNSSQETTPVRAGDCITDPSLPGRRSPSNNQGMPAQSARVTSPDLSSDAQCQSTPAATQQFSRASPQPMTPNADVVNALTCLLYTSPSPRDVEESRMPSSA